MQELRDLGETRAVKDFLRVYNAINDPILRKTKDDDFYLLSLYQNECEKSDLEYRCAVDIV